MNRRLVDVVDVVVEVVLVVVLLEGDQQRSRQEIRSR